jgi:hypothetical protein
MKFAKGILFCLAITATFGFSSLVDDPFPIKSLAILPNKQQPDYWIDLVLVPSQVR